MVNHVRTLLLNRASLGDAEHSEPGGAVIPPDYRPRRLPAFLQQMLERLYGTHPERLYQNYRLRQVMMLLHSSELESYVYGLDPRVTYLPFDDDSFFEDVFRRKTTQLAGDTSPLIVHGEHEPDEGIGVCTQRYRVEVLDDDTVEVIRQTPPLTVSRQTYVREGGLSSYIALIGSGLRIRFHAAPGTAWQVESVARPRIDFTVLMHGVGQALTTDGYAELFSGGEPQRTFRNLWEDHELFPYKYGGLLLAMAYYMDGLPPEE